MNEYELYCPECGGTLTEDGYIEEETGFSYYWWACIPEGDWYLGVYGEDDVDALLVFFA